MKNLIIIFDTIGEASLYFLGNKTYDIIFKLYEEQNPGSNGYSEMMEEVGKILEEGNKKGRVTSTFLQWNSHNHLKKPVTFRRILQLLYE